MLTHRDRRTLETTFTKFAVLSVNQFTFPVIRAHQGSQQTITEEISRMLGLNDTIHSMQFCY